MFPRLCLGGGAGTAGAAQITRGCPSRGRRSKSRRPWEETSHAVEALPPQAGHLDRRSGARSTLTAPPPSREAGRPRSLPQPDTAIRDHQQSSAQLVLEDIRQVTPYEQEGDATTHRRRPEQDNARVDLGWMGADVRDALIQREQHAALAPDEIEHYIVRRPGQTLVTEPVGFMARRSKIVEQFDREVLVELEPHAGLSGRRFCRIRTSSSTSSGWCDGTAVRWSRSRSLPMRQEGVVAQVGIECSCFLERPSERS